VEGKHEHKPIVIVKEIEVYSKKWHDFKLEMQATYDEATKRYKELEPLIKYIEEAMMDPEAKFSKQVEWISVKYGQMLNEYNEGTKLYNEKVKPYMAGAKLLELIGLNPYLERLIPSMKQF